MNPGICLHRMHIFAYISCMLFNIFIFTLCVNISFHVHSYTTVLYSLLIFYMSVSFHVHSYTTALYSLLIFYMSVSFHVHSYTTALYSLLIFYMSARQLLRPFRPVMKFVMVKAIIFVTFWQSIVVAILMGNGFIGFEPGMLG